MYKHRPISELIMCNACDVIWTTVQYKTVLFYECESFSQGLSANRGPY